MASSDSSSTTGGISFDQLLHGEKNYVCDSSCLVKIEKGEKFDEAKTKLVKNIEDILKSLRIAKGKPVSKFYIGKTYVKKPKKKNELDSMDPSTWIKKGIKDRWDRHNREDYGKDGLVVIAAIQRNQVPDDIVINSDKTPQEAYTLALEERLILHYLMEAKDHRCANETTNVGKPSVTEYEGNVLYVTFGY